MVYGGAWLQWQKKLLFYFWRKTFLWERGSASKRKMLSGFCKIVFPLERGSAGQGGRGDSDLPPMPPWTPYTPFKRPRDTPGPPLSRKGHFPLCLDRQGPYRARHLVWPGASNQSGAGASTHCAWPWCRGTYCGKVVLPWRHLAYTPRIDRRRGAGGGISCARPRFRQRRIRGSRSDLAFTK